MARAPSLILTAALACIVGCAGDASNADGAVTAMDGDAGLPGAGAAPASAGSGAAGSVAVDTAGRSAAANGGAGGAAMAGNAANAGSGGAVTSGASGSAGSGRAGVSGAAGGGAAGISAAGAAAAGMGGNAGSAGAAGSAAVGDITIWIAGDSTVAKGETPCPVGWGADFQMHFSDTAKVVNSAVGGRSVRTWLYNVGTTLDGSGECVLAKDSSGNPTVQARWQQMLDGMKTGDYLLIQFGINDSSATCDRHVGLAAFKESYGMMAKAAEQRGAHAIFLTPVSSISCNGSTARGTRGGYVTATQEAGQQYGVPVIDLHQRSVELYDSLGLCPIPGGSDVSASTTGKTGSFFCDDHTHFERTGAQQIGDLIVQALREQNIGLADYLE